MNGFEIFMHIVLGAVAIAVIGLVAWLIGAFLHWLYRIIFFNFGFTTPEVSDGIVTDMDYTPARHISNGKTTTYYPEQNEVYFETPQGKTMIDDETLYQRVRIDDEIKVKYQRRFIKPRYWEGSWSLDGYRLLSITNPKKRVIEFNDEKPITRGIK